MLMLYFFVPNIKFSPQLEEELQSKIYMVKIDECLIEKEQCEDSCRNVLMKNNVPLSVYTNTTSFVGVSARVESECTCDVVEPLICLNGGEFSCILKLDFV